MIAPNGQGFGWNVMPFGLANAPATFQELMNHIIAIMKRRPKVQQLLTKGAVIEAYIDDVFPGWNTIEDQKALIDDFLSVCDQWNTRAKIEKCGFMKEVVEYLGFQMGYQWWKPVEDQVALLLRAKIRNHPVQGVKDIRAFIGSCNFYLQHIGNFTYSSVLLTNLTKKSEKWEWTPAHRAEFEHLKSKLSSLSILGVPRAAGKLVFISDASDEGGGGNLYQWHCINEGAVERIRSELKTAGIDRDGSLKHTYDCSEFHLVPLGHWNWKWNSATSNYSVYERELLAGVLLLSSQTRLLAENPVVWLCDQASTSTFLKGLPPENPRLQRWWVFLSQLRLHIHQIQDLKNELSDYLSRTNIDERLQMKSEDPSKEAFQRIDTQLDLSLLKHKLLSVINPED